MAIETNGQLNAWWQRRLGSYVLDRERALLETVLPRLNAKHIVLLGCSEQMRLLSAGESPYQYVLNETVSAFTSHRGIRGSWANLPFLDSSVEAIVVPHTLEMLGEHTRPLFNEIYRALKPGGHIVVLGFNPSLIWRVWHVCYPKNCVIPWLGRCRKRGDLRFSLSLLDYRILQQRTILRTLPEDGSQKVTWVNRFLRVFKRIFPWMGGVYLLHAQKQVIGVTPKKVSWKPEYAKMDAGRVAPSQREAVENE